MVQWNAWEFSRCHRWTTWAGTVSVTMPVGYCCSQPTSIFTFSRLLGETLYEFDHNQGNGDDTSNYSEIGREPRYLIHDAHSFNWILSTTGIYRFKNI